MITVDEARRQGEALLAAAKASPIRQFRYELQARGREWERAAREFELCEGEGVIELVGSVVADMWVVGNAETPWLRVVRFTRGDGIGLQCEDENDPRPVYRNFRTMASPVVARP